MKELGCENNSSVTSSLFCDRLSWQNFQGDFHRKDGVLQKITEVEQSALIQRQTVWRNYSEQMTKKQNNFKTCTNSQKRKHLPCMETVLALTKKVVLVK